ncbi:MAG: hypothetical protein KF683_09390 [Rubrivivax sp.]|nr:hypothetical protein [Rubrivivax sp.]
MQTLSDRHPGTPAVAPAATTVVAAAPLAPGHRLGGFEILSALPDDGIGDDLVFYRALDHALGRPVALAELLPRALVVRAGDGSLAVPAVHAEEHARRLEAHLMRTRVLATCEHAHLVRVLGLLPLPGTLVTVMPPFDGRPLRELRRAWAAPPDETALLRLLDPLLGALQALHDAGCLHGAVHPERVLQRPDGSALLLHPGPDQPQHDFAAPELRCAPSERRPGPWSDLHALAWLARWLITTMAPTRDAGAPEPLADLVQRLFFDQPAVQYRPALLRVLDLAASPDIRQRPATAADFRAWLADPPAPAVAVPGAAAATSGRPAAPPAGDEEVDDTMREVIRRVIASVPDSGPLRPPAAAAEPVAALQAAEDEAHDDGHADAPVGQAPPSTAAAPRWRPVAVVAGSLLVAAVLAFQARGLMTPPPLSAGVGLVVGEAEAPPAPVALPAAPAPGDASLAPTAATLSPTAMAVPPATPPAEAAAAPPPALAAPAPRPPSPPARAASPRQACGERTPFALYRCMQRLCTTAAWRGHAQCIRLRETDRVD